MRRCVRSTNAAVINAARDAALVGDDDDGEAGPAEQPDRVGGVRVDAQLGQVGEVADILVDGAVAVEEDRRPSGALRHPFPILLPSNARSYSATAASTRLR